jgi:DNA-binding NarL/FixJ family response regulator
MFMPTETQFRILELLKQGQSNKAMAHKLSLSVAAIEYHMHRLFDLTGTANRVELAVWWKDYSRVNPFDRDRGAADGRRPA